MNVPMISKLLPKGSIQDHQESDDELPRRTNQPDSDDPEQEAAPRLTRKKKEVAEYDDSRPAAHFIRVPYN